MFSKSAKNVFDMVIGPVKFRKTGYFATWWRLVAREHDFKPKMKVFLLLVNFKKLKNTRHGLVRVKKCHLIIEKPLKFYQKKKYWTRRQTTGIRQPVYWSYDHFSPSWVQFENRLKADK